jgi:tRNA A-37 threonylcarbamoyl transferase component Bud32
MITVKDTLRATVRVSFDGEVSKQFHGAKAQERFANEVSVLRHLEAQQCPFVPRVIKTDPITCTMITTNCGSRVHHLDEQRCKELFDQLEEFGIQHEDPDIRNVTYRQQDGRFCLIDFEFATFMTKRVKKPPAPHASSLPAP